MSLMLNAKDNQIAFIANEKGKREGTLSFSESQDGDDSIELEDGYTFQLAPRPLKEKERMTLFIGAESGAGKSYFAREYAKEYH